MVSSCQPLIHSYIDQNQYLNIKSNLIIKLSLSLSLEILTKTLSPSKAQAAILLTSNVTIVMKLLLIYK